MNPTSATGSLFESVIEASHAFALPAVLATERVPAAALALFGLLERMNYGRLTVVTPGGNTLQFGHGEIHARIRLNNWNVCAAALSRGDIGFAESFIAGDWQTDQLATLMKVLLANRQAIEKAIYGRWWGQLAYRLRHLLNRNSKAGSRRNIHAHYDLGNRFYALWLDPSMTYSSALFGEHASCSLQQAQEAKYQRILDELALAPGARILEIGCGWGGFAEVAARAGMHVTGLTLSTEQLAWARQRLDDAGLGAKADLRLQDYRDEQGQYDAIVSIEMFEAVGEAYWPTYFDTLRRCLKPGGRAVVQTITIDDELFERYRQGTDFIQQYIFPGGMLPCPGGFKRSADRAGLAVDETFAFGPDYARTLAQWGEAFRQQWPRIEAQGFDVPFARTWAFYLAYCEAGFAQGATDVIQFTLRAPG
ncbi:MAG: class I SAM-dependent methyltransferase [Burkholderiaceae bacterium]